MAQERTEALVLRGVDYSETSRIVTFLTPGRGRLACIAKGARRPKSSLSSALDTFNQVELVYTWKDGRDIQPLVDVTLLHTWRRMKSDLEAGAYGAVLLEAGLRIAHENEPSEGLFAALVGACAAFDEGAGEPAAVAVWGLLAMLSRAGYEPALYQCVFCGASPGARAFFSFDGGVACARCGGDVALDEARLAALRALSERAPSGPVDGADSGLFRMAYRYAARQLDVELRSVRVLEQLTMG